MTCVSYINEGDFFLLSLSQGSSLFEPTTNLKEYNFSERWTEGFRSDPLTAPSYPLSLHPVNCLQPQPGSLQIQD